MTFLAPIPAIIAGAIAIPALLLYYFLKLRRQPIRVSSTLLWTQATRDLQVNVPLRMIRPSWLLAMQMLGLLLLLLALARPALNMDEAPADRVLILIDTSASMAARDGDGGQTRLERAKARAFEIVDRGARLGAASRVMIVEFAAQPRAVTNFTMDRGALRDAIAAIEQTDQPGRLRPAIEFVAAAVATDADESARPELAEVILLSDGSFDEPTRALAIPGARVRYEAMGEILETESRDNFGIVALSARRDYEDPAVVRVFVRVQSAAAEAAATSLVLAVGGVEIERAALTVPGRDARGAPGQAATTFELHSPGAGVVTVVLGGRDLLSADNAAGVVLDPPLRPSVLVVTRDDDPALGEPARGPTVLLLDALRELGPSRLRVVGLRAYEATRADAAREHDLAIFVNAAPQDPPPLPSVSFGPIWTMEGLTQRPSSRPTPFVSWQRAHPILRDVSLDAVHVARPMPLILGEVDSGRVRATELATGAEGALIVLADDAGFRRVLVAFDLAQSTWPVHFGFPIFLSNVIEFLATGGTGPVGRAFRTDEPAEIRVTTSGEVRLIAPTGERLPVRPSAVQPRTESAVGRIPLGVLPRAGMYRVEGAGGGGDTVVAVNLLDEHESLLAVAEAMEIGGETIRAATAERQPVEIWPWFIIAGLIVLGIEWFLSAFLMRT